MMKQKYIFVSVLLLVLMLAGVGLTELYVRQERAESGEAFRVVTSFYPMYIAAENIIGSCSGVELQDLSGPQTGCMHDYQLTTEDMVKLSGADVFIVNCGGIENFLSDVAKQYPDLQMVYASEPLELLEDNAHAWMSIQDYMTQVRAIADALVRFDKNKSHGELYKKNSTAYLEKLQKLKERQEQLAQALREELPQEGHAHEKTAAGGTKQAVIFHEAFAYTARDLNLAIAGSMDLDEERQVSAGEVADMLKLIQEHGVQLILAEELYGKRMCETLQKEADVKVVYLDTCVRGDYHADSYLNAMEENLAKLEQAILNPANP